jgi:predicted RNA-binding protein YlxR (DUF448 family)
MRYNVETQGGIKLEIVSPRTGRGVYSVSNRNEHQKQKKKDCAQPYRHL